MSLRGGYQIIDLSDVQLTSGTAAVIVGTGAQVLHAVGRRTRAVLSGLNLAGKLYPDLNIDLEEDGEGVYQAAVLDLTVKFETAADKVTVTES